MIISDRRRQEIDNRNISQPMINNQISEKSFDSWKPISLGGLKKGAKDWLSKDYQDEVSEF